jgi:hypothetical protein
MLDGLKEGHQRDFAALPDVRDDALHRAPHHLQCNDRPVHSCYPALCMQDFDMPEQKHQHDEEVLTWERSSLSFSYSGVPRSSPAAQQAQHCSYCRTCSAAKLITSLAAKPH